MVRGKKEATQLRAILPLGAVTLFSLFLFFWIAPIDQLNALRNVDFTSIVFVFWLAFVGLVLISLGILALPEMGNTPARIAGIFFIGLGLVALIFAVLIMIDGNVSAVMADQNLRFITALLFGVVSIVLLADLLPRIITGKGIVEVVNA